MIPCKRYSKIIYVIYLCCWDFVQDSKIILSTYLKQLNAKLQVVSYGFPGEAVGCKTVEKNVAKGIRWQIHFLP